MAEDWSIDVKKYVPDADDRVIAGIVRYCGIALRNRDSSLVSFTDKTETDRVRENFLKKKLALTEPDDVLDGAIAAVGTRMQGDSTRNRVTVYYLLAEAFAKLALFLKAGEEPMAVVAPPAAVPPAPEPPAPVPPPAAPVSLASPVPPVPPVPPVAAAPLLTPLPERRAPAARVTGSQVLVPIALLGVVGFGTWAIVSGGGPVPAGIAPPPAAMAPMVAAPPAIPEGAGVIAAETEGKPMLSVYFDTAKADVTPEFAAAAAPIKAWVDGHPGSRLAVSGFNDPRGDKALNAELSKNRAQNVAAALAALGVPADSIDLVKPAETSDATTDLAGARRVEVTVR